MLTLNQSKEKLKSCTCPSLIYQKGITCGTAVGAKQDSAKGNKQKAYYHNQEIMDEKSDMKYWGNVRWEIKLRALWKSLLDKHRKIGNGRNRGWVVNAKTWADERKWESSIRPCDSSKGITCRTAAGAKQGRTKRNHQKCLVRDPGNTTWEIRYEIMGKT